MPLPRCPCDRASLNLRRARRKSAASRCSLERDHPCTTAKADGREDPFHDSSSSSDFVLFPLHHTSDWSPARERVEASLGRVASAPFWPSPITSASVANRHHTAGAPPTVHFQLRQPSNPTFSPPNHRQCLPHLLLDFFETDFAKMAVASGPPAARQAAFDASSVHHQGRN